MNMSGIWPQEECIQRLKARAGFYLRAVPASFCTMVLSNLVEHESQLREETKEICSHTKAPVPTSSNRSINIHAHNAVLID